MKKKDDNKKTIDLIIKIILIIIIILLLIHNCVLVKKDKNSNNKVPNGNVNIIEIKCDDNKCVNKKINSLSFAQTKASVKQSETINLIVIVKPSDLSDEELLWTSSDPSIATVDANGVVKGIKKGTVTITVKSLNGKKATCIVEVTDKTVKVKKIRLVSNKDSIKTGSTTQIIAYIEPEDATNRNLVWTSSDSSIATVDDNGFVKGLKSGTVTITAKTKDGKVKATKKIIITKAEETKQIESLSFAQEKVSVKKGDSLGLIITVNPSDLASEKLTWISSDPSIVTVDANGVIKGIKPGMATITVTSSNGKKATCKVTVSEDTVEVSKINLTTKEDTITPGSTTQINATIEPENATNRELVWSSSNPSIATVDSKGVVKGLKSGTVTITAKTKDGKVMATKTITIKKEEPKQIESLSFAQDNVSIKKDDTLGLIVTVKPSELASEKLTWTSSDTNIVTVDANGNIKGIKPGTATITAKSTNGKKATCTVTVTTDEVEVEEIILTPEDNTIDSNSTTQVIAEIKPENATNRELVWESSDPSIATVDDKGIVKGLKSGTVTITAKTKDGKVVASTTITIKPTPTPTPSPTPTSTPYGLQVYDEEKDSLTWNGSTDLKIFSNSMYNIEGVIAPESSNVYQFVVKNSTNTSVKYNITFVENNIYHINMKYKLKRNDTYVVDHYVSYNELVISDKVLTSGEQDTYYLEWKWISNSNDTEIGRNPDARYGLTINVEAEGINE